MIREGLSSSARTRFECMVQGPRIDVNISVSMTGKEAIRDDTYIQKLHSDSSNDVFQLSL